MEPLLQDLQRGIGKIKYLLVLDDVWDDDRESWNMLKDPLSSGAKGSKILLTTRSKRVGDAAGVGESCNLEGLSEGDSWELLKKIAFQQRQHESNDPELVKIGKLIVRKCGGVPLALKTMGGLLSNKTNEEWLQFQDQELSTITQAEENDIFPMLKLSYDHLQPNLRQCFAYCSLFPKDYWFFKERLIRLWIAQGFIQSSTRSQSLEGVGNQYFMHLLHMSFFQEPEKDSLGNIKAVKMHDLMHDIAVGVAKSECLHIDRCVEIIREKVRHVSSHYGKQTTSRDLSSALCYANRVRAMFYIELNSYSSFKHLRALELAGMKLMEVPKSICGLKSLRYLDISNNNLCSLPNCIATLINLQTLDLVYNFDLRELPEDLKDLGNLRHLVLDECYDLICMPCGIDKLSCLQTLSKFVVGCDASSKFSADISELTGLNNLRGTLKIVNSRNRISKFKPEVLQNKKGIEILEIDFGACSEEKEMVVDDEALLKGVLELSNLRNLKVTGYNVKEAQNTQRLSFQLPSLVKFEAYESKCKYLPNFGHLPNLKFIDISYLTRLTYLPPINHLNSLVSINLKELATLQQIPILDQLHLLKSVTFNHLMAIKDLPKLHDLPLLEHLQLEKLTSLEYIQEEEVEEEEKHYVSSSLHSNSNSAVVAATPPLFFPSLKSLLLRRIPNLKGWWKRVNSSSSSSSSSITALHFPVLSKLSIFVCPNLMSMPFFPCVESLSLTNCNKKLMQQQEEYMKNWVIAPSNEPSSSSFTSSSPSASLISSPFFKMVYLKVDKSVENVPEGLLQHFTSLKKLEFQNYSEATKMDTLPKKLLILRGTLQQLYIFGNVKFLPDWIAEFTSLQLLQFSHFNQTELPKGLDLLTSLKQLRFFSCKDLTALPETMTALASSLQQLHIEYCPKLEFIPHWLSQLTSLQQLWIRGCPKVEERYRNEGADWPNIAHIPLILISGK